MTNFKYLKIVKFEFSMYVLTSETCIGADFMFLVLGQNAKGAEKHQDVDGVE